MDKDKRKNKKRQESSDSSDLEQLLEISKKYKNRPRPKEREEIPIMRKVQAPKPPETQAPPLPPPPPPTSAGIILSQFPKGENDAYKIPQHLHKNYLHAIRLYLGNLPDQFEKDELQKYLRTTIEQAGGSLEKGDPITQIQLQPQQKYCFVQFRSIEETEAALQLEGLLFKGKPLKFRRVKDFEISPKVQGERPIPKLNQQKLTKSDGNLRLHVSGLSPDTDEEWLARILGEYGSLKSLNVARDKNNKNVCKGYAFCEFETELETQNCVNGLNNRVIGGRLLQVKKGANLAINEQQTMMSTDYIVETITLQEQTYLEMRMNQIDKMKVSSVVKISNAIRVDQIEDDQEYQFVVKDLRKEIDKIGRLISLVVPRKKEGHNEGVGNIYLEFENEQYAKICVILLDGLKYDNKELKVQFYDARLYADKLY